MSEDLNRPTLARMLLQDCLALWRALTNRPTRPQRRALLNALASLTEAIASLTSAVDRATVAITNGAGVPEADVQAAADAVQTQATLLLNALDQSGTPAAGNGNLARRK